MVWEGWGKERGRGGGEKGEGGGGEGEGWCEERGRGGVRREGEVGEVRGRGGGGKEGNGYDGSVQVHVHTQMRIHDTPLHLIASSDGWLVTTAFLHVLSAS